MIVDLTSILNSQLSVDISTAFQSVKGRISSLVSAFVHIRIKTAF